MATPNWLGASSNSAPQANQVNQFLGTHASTVVYTGTSQASQTTAGSGSTSTNGLYLAQTFTTAGSFSATRTVLNLSVTGVPNLASVSIQTNSAGAPSGTIVGGVATNLPYAFVGAGAGNISMPMIATLAASTQYWIVINAVGSVGNLFSWFKSNQASGASTSTNGTAWTAQTYGFLYNVFAGVSGQQIHTWEDSGARWTTSLTAAGTSSLANLYEYTTAQAANDYVSSARTFNDTNGLLTSIT